ncbi:Thermophilic serine proteinase precursor [compost metagenome]
MKAFHLPLALMLAGTVAGCGVAPSIAPNLNGDSATSMSAARKAGQVEGDAVLVKVKRDGDLEAIAREHGLTVSRKISALGLAELRTSQAGAGWLDRKLNELSRDSRVAFAEPNLAVKLKNVKSSSLPAGTVLDAAGDPLRKFQYSLDAMNVPEAWKTTQGDRKIVVAVIDSGVDAGHKDLKANLTSNGYDAYNSRQGTKYADTNTVSRFGGPFTSFGHGTHVAGIIGAVANNDKGIVGVAPNCTLMPIKIFPGLIDSIRPKPNDRGEDQTAIIASAVAEGIVYATEHGASIINMSLGFPYESQSLSLAVEFALKKGVTVLVAAGNERMEGSPVNTLANLPGVIGVGATDEDDKVTFFSNKGKYVSVSAPGWRVLSTMPSVFNGLISEPYQYMDGTSMACPNAAGVAALVKSVNPSLTPAQVKEILEKSSDDRGPQGFDENYGHGRVNAARAVAMASKR